jgi:glucose-6-phosphate 1-dehydrogenase
MPGSAVEPHLLVILGGTGDLAARKLLPALFELTRERELDSSHAVLAVARAGELDDAGYRTWAREALSEAGYGPDEILDWCDAHLFYQAAPSGSAEEYAALAARIEEIESAVALPGNRVFYLALPPRAFTGAIEGLATAGLNTSTGWTRLVIEKPFGRDLDTARELNALVHERFDESQVYRIDHYLGKETVQNLLVFRFSNPIFESIWSRDRVESVQITVGESLGVGSRAGYYDRAGALRDMVQNHVAQLVCLVGMEVPSAFEAEAVRYEKIKLLKAVASIRPEDVVFGQYRSGSVESAEAAGYLEEPGVDPGSKTETFAAMKLSIDTWRWQGVPFYIRTGKRLPHRLTQIAVTFREPPVCLFESVGGCQTHNNVLFLTLQPNEGFALCFDVKVPGEPFALRTLPLDFYYRDAFGPIPDAYQTLLLDVLLGDQTLFVHSEWTEASWRLFTPLLERDHEILGYESGSWGPAEADRLLERGGHRWMGLPDIRGGHGMGGMEGE